MSELGRYRQFVSGYTIIPATEPTASRFAQLRALLRKQGNSIQDVDLLIAATALTHDLTLLTRNIKHFERIPDFASTSTASGSVGLSLAILRR